MPLKAIKSQIAAGIDIIVHLGRLRDKSRRVLEIVEIVECKNEEIQLNSLFKFVECKEGEDNKVIGKLVSTGQQLMNRGKLEAAGFQLEI